MTIKTVGLDLARDVFQVHCVSVIDRRIVNKKRSNAPSCRLLRNFTALRGWHGGMWVGASLGARAAQTWSRRSSDACRLRQTLCEEGQDRCSRCGGDPRAGALLDDALL